MSTFAAVRYSFIHSKASLKLTVSLVAEFRLSSANEVAQASRLLNCCAARWSLSTALEGKNRSSSLSYS